MSKLIKPSRYKATIIEHGITKTKSGDPQAAVKFEFETEDGYRQLTWYGSFKEKALEHTIKALVACGLEGNNPAGKLALGSEVSITVEIDKNNEGKERNVVRWVNGLNEIPKLEPTEAAAMLEQYSGAVMAFKQKSASAPPPAAKKQASGGERFPWDD